MTNSAYKAVMFDLDGTLLDTYDLILSSSRYCTQQVMNKTFSEEFYMSNIGRPLDAVVATYSDDKDLQKEMIKVYREHNESIHDKKVKEFEGIAALLHNLHEVEYKEAVVTSKKRELAERGLTLFHYDSYMEFVIGAYDCTEHKPEPGPVLLGAKKLGFSPQECLYVGDSPFDIQAGNAAGCDTAAVLWGMFTLEELQKCNPTYICKTPQELADILLSV